jgi:hypothetical protein
VITDGILFGKRGEDGERLRGEALHNIPGAAGVVGKRVVVADEPAHVGGHGGAAAEDLRGDVVEVVVGIRGEVVDVASIGRDDYVGIELAGRVVPLVSIEAVNVSIGCLHEAEHVIEGAIFEHQDYKMLDWCRHARTSNELGAEVNETTYYKISNNFE